MLESLKNKHTWLELSKHILCCGATGLDFAHQHSFQRICLLTFTWWGGICFWEMYLVSCIFSSNSFMMTCKGHFSRAGCVCKLPKKEILGMKHPLNSKYASCLETATSHLPLRFLLFIISMKNNDEEQKARFWNIYDLIQLPYIGVHCHYTYPQASLLALAVSRKSYGSCITAVSSSRCFRNPTAVQMAQLFL